MDSISVIIPLFNEAASLEDLYRELRPALLGLGLEWEIIFVDDGSGDGSFDILDQLREKDPRIGIVQLRRNFGKSAALSAGFAKSHGDIIVTLDADLQDQPSELAKLVEKIHQGDDLVSGWKRVREDPISKRWPSWLFNKVTSFLTGIPLHDINCGLKAYRREVIEEVRVYGEMHRYIPVLASYRGFRVSEVPVEHRARRHGKSKFGASRFLGGFFDLITVIMLTRYNSKPLHVFGILGSLLLFSGTAIEFYLSIGWLFDRYIGDRPLFMLGVVFIIVGIQFVFFGLVAEMIAYSTKREEYYSVRRVVNVPTERVGSRPAALVP